MVRDRERSVLWVMRLAVVALAFTVSLLDSRLDALHDETSLVATIALWTLWAGLLLSVLVPSSTSLTALRLIAPTHTAVSLMVVGTDNTGLSVWPAIAAVTISVMATVAALSGDTGRYYVQVSAYGDERRFLLSCPPQMIAVQTLTWMIWLAAAAVAAISLTGDDVSPTRLIIGGLGTALTGFGFLILPQRFHRFSRRWLVWVPAGIVLHDPVVLAETAMMARQSIRDVRLWSPGDEPEPLNVTGGRLRPGVVIALREIETMILSATPDHPGGHAMHVQSFLVRPTRLKPALAAMMQRLSER